MPIFNYKCETCGEHFESLAKVDELPSCPKCNSEKTKKELSAPARVKINGPRTTNLNKLPKWY